MGIILFCNDCQHLKCVAQKNGRLVFSRDGLFDCFLATRIEDCNQRFNHKPETDTDKIIRLDFSSRDDEDYS